MKWCKFNASNISHCTTTRTQTRADLDTKSDTLCGGTNIWFHKVTGEICIVPLFSASYDPMQDVQTSTCLTAYTDEYGRTQTLFFNKDLCFGTSMEHLLTNPNQI